MRETPNIFANRCYLGSAPGALTGMGLVITPLLTSRRFHPLGQPLETPQKLGGRELVWRFDGGDITSDGGALVLRRLEQRTGIVRRFAACFTDYRSPKQIEHPLLDLITQRVFGLALGYEDLNDHDQLRSDPMLAVALNKDDVKGEQRRRPSGRAILSRLLPGLLLSAAVRVLRRALVRRTLADCRHRCLGRFGGGVGAGGSAHSPTLAGSEDSAAGRRRLLTGETDGVVRARGPRLYLRTGAE